MDFVGSTRAEIGRATGITYRNIMNYDTGSTPNLENVARFLKKYHTSISWKWLLWAEGEMVDREEKQPFMAAEARVAYLSGLTKIELIQQIEKQNAEIRTLNRLLTLRSSN